VTTTLLLRLTGPVQAWGTGSRFEVRDTGLEPSKSGVVGLLAAALGRRRDADLADLAALRMAVRVDREPATLRDFHTAHGVARVAGREARGEDGAVVSERFYLSDADFLVGLEGDPALLEALDAAVRRPRFPLSLGRRACLPSLPVALPGSGLRVESLEAALLAEPLGISPRPREAVRLVTEVAPGEGSEVRHDQPVGAAFVTRHFVARWVRTRRVPLPGGTG
jgi:CRISPR system Cascade subunit CasD